MLSPEIVLEHYSVHFVYVNGDALFSRNNHLYHYHQRTGEISKLLSLDYRYRLEHIVQHPYLIRLFRLGITHTLGLSDRSLLIFFN
ncbi:MAG: hypothetical protein V3U24_05620, partial [Candidatus Neomarinimicrobiota bacterium]